MKISDIFYTEKQASEVLGVNRITIWRWVKSGRLNAQYIGREALIPKWEIELIKEKRAK